MHAPKLQVLPGQHSATERQAPPFTHPHDPLAHSPEQQVIPATHGTPIAPHDVEDAELDAELELEEFDEVDEEFAAAALDEPEGPELDDVLFVIVSPPKPVDAPPDPPRPALPKRMSAPVPPQVETTTSREAPAPAART